MADRQDDVVVVVEDVTDGDEDSVGIEPGDDDNSYAAAASIQSDEFNPKTTVGFNDDYTVNSVWNSTTQNPYIHEAPDNDEDGDGDDKSFIPFRGGDIPMTSSTTTSTRIEDGVFMNPTKDNAVADDTRLDQHGNSLPHPETMKMTQFVSNPGKAGEGGYKNPALATTDRMIGEDVTASTLGDHGNSLPHPDTMNKNVNNDGGRNDLNDNLLMENGSSLPHPETMKTSETMEKQNNKMGNGVAEDLTDVDAENLGEDGNSLPHPDTMTTNNNSNKFGRLSSVSQKNSGNDVNDNLLINNGSSLPHPETMKIVSSKSMKKVKIGVADDIMDVDAENLGEDGNSLPHPDAIHQSLASSSAAATAASVANSKSNINDALLDDHGCSLPHPETLKRFGKVGAGTAAAAGAATTNGTVVGDVDAETGLFDNGNSLPHPDSLARFTPAVQAAAVVNAIEEDHYFANDDLLADANSSSSGNGSSSSSSPSDDEDDEENEDRLDENGNSLPHPDTMFSSAATNNSSSNATARSSTTSRWGNLRNSVLSTISTNRRLSSNDEANLSSFDDNDDNSSNFAINAADTAATAVLVQRDSNSAPNSLFSPQNSATGQQQNRWQTLGRSVLSSLHTSAATPREEQDLFLDEEDGTDSFNPTTNSTGLNNNYNSNGEDTISFAYEVEPYDDDSNREGTSGLSTSSSNKNTNRRDGLLLTSSNGRYTWRCYLLIFAIFLIFLGVLIPLVALAKDRRNSETEIPSENSNNNNIISLPPKIPDNIAAPPPTPVIVVITPPLPTAAPTFSPVPIIDDGTCKDEMVFLDKNGKVIEDEDELCFTTTEIVRLQYTYCNPTSIGDWMGLFPARSLFMDRLYKSYIFGKILECLDDNGGTGATIVNGIGSQSQRPCSVEDLGKPQVNVKEISPVIDPGEYRFFVVKNSYWPHQYVTYSPAFRVVIDAESCKVDDNIFMNLPVSAAPEPTLDDYDYDYYYGDDDISSVDDQLFLIGDNDDESDRDDDNGVGDFLGNLIGGVTGNDDLGDKVEDHIEDLVDNIGDFIDGIFVGEGDDPTTNNVFGSN